MGIGAFEDTFDACSMIERVGSGLDSKGEGDGDDCSESFELHFGIGENITARDEDKGRKVRNECEEGIGCSPNPVQCSAVRTTGRGEERSREESRSRYE